MKRMTVACCGLLAIGNLSTFAADVGDPIFPKDLGDKNRAEIVYQSLDRRLDTGSTLSDDVYILRMHTEIGQSANLDFDLGGINPAHGDMGFYGGVGLRYLAYDGGSFRVSPWAQVHYAPDYKTATKNTDSLVDADGGVRLAYLIHLDRDFTVVPYVGPIFSIVRVNGDKDAHEDHAVGGVAGLSLQMPGDSSVRIEGQFFDHSSDQPSVSAAAGVAF